MCAASGDPGNDGADYLARVGASSAAIEDYDWDMRREAVEKNTRDLQSRRIAAPREKFQVLLEDLWTADELDELEATDFA